MLHLRVRLDEPTCVLIGQKMLSGCKISSPHNGKHTDTNKPTHTHAAHLCVRTQDEHTKSTCEYCNKTNTAHTDAESFSYCNIRLLFSSHKSLQNRRFAATGSKEMCFSLRVTDLRETGAFYSHVSQLRRVCSLI